MITGETIWITGASSGIGEEMARQLAKAGNNVIATARDAGKLQRLCEDYPLIMAMPADVTDRQSLTALESDLRARDITIDRVIINAGTCEYLDMSAPDWTLVDRVMAVNFHGAVNTAETALALFSKLRNHKSHLIVIASLASVVAFPQSEAYGASKAAVQYFFESLRIDLAAKNVSVTVVQPGFVKTPLTDQNDFAMPFMVSASSAASLILRKIEHHPLRISFPRRLAMPLYFFHLFPRLWNWIAINKLSRTPSSGKAVR